MKLPTLTRLLEEKSKPADHKHEFDCLMLQVQLTGWSKLLKLIDPEDLYTDQPGYGLETDPHVTALYGIHPQPDGSGQNVRQVADYLTETYPNGVKLTLTALSVFYGDEYDVVKFDVVSPDLVAINGWLKSQLEHTDTYPDYRPHMTVAYVKAGRGAHYERALKAPLTVSSQLWHYSTTDGLSIHFD